MSVVSVSGNITSGVVGAACMGTIGYFGTEYVASLAVQAVKLYNDSKFAYVTQLAQPQFMTPLAVAECGAIFALVDCIAQTAFEYMFSVKEAKSLPVTIFKFICTISLTSTIVMNAGLTSSFMVGVKLLATVITVYALIGTIFKEANLISYGEVTP